MFDWSHSRTRKSSPLNRRASPEIAPEALVGATAGGGEPDPWVPPQKRTHKGVRSPCDLLLLFGVCFALLRRGQPYETSFPCKMFEASGRYAVYLMQEQGPAVSCAPACVSGPSPGTYTTVPNIVSVLSSLSPLGFRKPTQTLGVVACAGYIQRL